VGGLLLALCQSDWDGLVQFLLPSDYHKALVTELQPLLERYVQENGKTKALLLSKECTKIARFLCRNVWDSMQIADTAKFYPPGRSLQLLWLQKLKRINAEGVGKKRPRLLQENNDNDSASST
jgi:hypothetical protein